MRIFLFVIMAAVTVAAMTMVWLNRGSEKIVTTFLLGLVATFGALMALFFYGADEPIHKAFSSAVMIDATSHLPFELLGFTSLPMENLILTRDEINKRPEHERLAIPRARRSTTTLCKGQLSAGFNSNTRPLGK